MKKTFIVIFALLLLIFLLFVLIDTIRHMPLGGKTVYVKDVTKEQTFLLESGDKNASITGIDIIIRGFINGSATINRYYENGKLSDSFEIKGKVRRLRGCDFYSSSLKLEYVPDNVESGHLKIEYRFVTLSKMQTHKKEK